MLVWQQLFSQAVIEGQGLKFSGPGFSFGIADTVANAEPGLQNDKARREREGLRAGRGERPSGVSNADQRNDGTTTENVPDGAPQGEGSAVGGISPEEQQPGLSTQAAQATAILDAANVTGKERIDVLKAAYPAAEGKPAEHTVFRLAVGDAVRGTAGPSNNWLAC